MPSAPSLAPTAQRPVGTTAGRVRAGRASAQGQSVSTLLGMRGSLKRNALGGVGIAGTVIWVSPVVAWILIGGLLIAVGMIFAVAAVAVLRADATLSPFDRLIRFAGLLLNRAPHASCLAPTRRHPRQSNGISPENEMNSFIAWHARGLGFESP